MGGRGFTRRLAPPSFYSDYPYALAYAYDESSQRQWRPEAYQSGITRSFLNRNLFMQDFQKTGLKYYTLEIVLDFDVIFLPQTFHLLGQQNSF